MRSRLDRWGLVVMVVAGCASLFWMAEPALAMTQFLDRARKN